MSEMKPTPGPWEAERIYNSNCFDITCECGFFIATCHDCVRGESNAEANARLIAAAPELLEALAEVVNAADGEGWSQLDPSLSKARAAIAKALPNAAAKEAGK